MALNRHNFEIAELAPDDPARLTFCGILVAPDGTSETDGTQAIIVSASEQTQPNLFANAEDISPADHFTPFILDRESALKIAKAIPKKTENLEATFAVVDATTENSQRAMVSINDIYRQEILRATKIEGKFPEILRVIPSLDQAHIVLMMDPDILVSVLKAVQKFCKGHETASVTLSLFGTGQPLRIDAKGMGQSMVAVVMPQRSETKGG